MSKKIFCIVMSILLAFGLTGDLTGSPAAGRVRAAQPVQAGITLDCARRYYSPKELREYIDLLAGRSGSFLQLHLTDNENVGIECAFLGQTEKEADKTADSACRNPRTKGLFLTDKEIKDLITYAQKRNVDLVPEIDAPAHMGGFLKLAENSSQKEACDLQADDGELDLSDPQSVVFVQKLYDEYAALFQGCRYFHIGCDELFSATDEDAAAYISQISGLLMQKGYTVRIWNDLLTKSNIRKISRKIQVTYWSYDGDTEDPDEKSARRASRVSAAQLQFLGFQVLLYNSYYLYYIPSADNDSTEDRAYMVNDLKAHWDLHCWDGEDGTRLKSTTGIAGAAISVWGEDSKGISDAEIYRQTKALYEAMISKM